MSKGPAGYRVVPFPKVRFRIVDFLRLMHDKHVIHSLTELDVTKPREYIRQHKSRTGEPVIHCLLHRVLVQDR